MSKFSAALARLIVCALCTLVMASAASAATVGYWRFEDSPQTFLQDSSGNGYHLTGGAMVEGTHQSPIPVSGEGSAFPTTIPLTGAANSYMANATASRYGTTPDIPAFTPSAFTIEAFVNADNAASYRMFAAHWGAGTRRSWGAGLTDFVGTSQRLKLFLGNVTGTAFSTFEAPSSAFDLALNKDYYIAMSWDGSLTGSGNGGIKFYIKNLTDNTALVSASVDHNIAALHDSNQPITIGANTSSGLNPWVGLLDEVRFSNSALSISELLITAPPVVLPVPEPSTMVLAAFGLALLKRRRREV